MVIRTLILQMNYYNAHDTTTDECLKLWLVKNVATPAYNILINPSWNLVFTHVNNLIVLTVFFYILVIGFIVLHAESLCVVWAAI